jgi:hypothetical protein
VTFATQSALSGHADRVQQCLLSGGDLNGSTQHFILNG